MWISSRLPTALHCECPTWSSIKHLTSWKSWYNSKREAGGSTKEGELEEKRRGGGKKIRKHKLLPSSWRSTSSCSPKYHRAFILFHPSFLSVSPHFWYHLLLICLTFDPLFSQHLIFPFTCLLLQNIFFSSSYSLNTCYFFNKRFLTRPLREAADWSLTQMHSSNIDYFSNNGHAVTPHINHMCRCVTASLWQISFPPSSGADL